jgi:hypothetical protein
VSEPSDCPHCLLPSWVHADGACPTSTTSSLGAPSGLGRTSAREAHCAPLTARELVSELVAKNEALTTENERLTRELREAREAIKEAKHLIVEVSEMFAGDWLDLPAVRAAMKEGK